MASVTPCKQAYEAGARLLEETHDVGEIGWYLKHTELETTRICATWRDKRLRETSGWW